MPQSTQRKNFITINEGFKCQNCGQNNEKLDKSCRNHCKNCLFSLHVDEEIPGDRKSTCKALMKPIKASQNTKKGWIIYHKCVKCGKIITNKSAPDDDFDKIIELTLINEPPRSQKIRR
jgi:DNA-directed RNA polymerase subunit RPC12/RpoP